MFSKNPFNIEPEFKTLEEALQIGKESKLSEQAYKSLLCKVGTQVLIGASIGALVVWWIEKKIDEKQQLTD